MFFTHLLVHHPVLGVGEGKISPPGQAYALILKNENRLHPFQGFNQGLALLVAQDKHRGGEGVRIYGFTGHDGG